MVYTYINNCETGEIIFTQEDIDDLVCRNMPYEDKIYEKDILLCASDIESY